LITESTEAADGPKDWHSIFGSTLLTKAGPKPTADVVANKKLIGLYFSASWCGPCKRFTPELVNIYEARKKTAADFEIIWLSACDTAPEMDAYYADNLPDWPAVPFQVSQGDDETRGVGFVRKKKRQAGLQQGVLGARFDVQFVPRLTLLDAETGDTILESAHDDTAFVPAVDTGKPDLERVWAEIAGLRPPAVGSRGYAS
jgi:thiol-disulfide isomerase/thioredoxin